MARAVLEKGWMKRQVDIIKEESDKWPDWRKREAENRFMEGNYEPVTTTYTDGSIVTTTTHFVKKDSVNQPKSIPTLTEEWMAAHKELESQQEIVNDLRSQYNKAECSLQNIKNREDSLWVALQKARESK